MIVIMGKMLRMPFARYAVALYIYQVPGSGVLIFIYTFIFCPRMCMGFELSFISSLPNVTIGLRGTFSLSIGY
jgi:hypothetical protein